MLVIQLGSPGLAVPKTVTVEVTEDAPPAPERPAPAPPPAQAEKKYPRTRRLV